MIFGTKTIGLLERRITKTAEVLQTRPWENGTFYEVDLHIPTAELDTPGVQHMKCRVGALTYRDYTISAWDAETKTCTLFIDAAHQGAGSAWVKTLHAGDTVSYLHIESRRYMHTPDKPLLFLGDQSAVGHFLALQQLAGKDTPISGAIVLPDATHRAEIKAYYPQLPLQPLDMDDTGAYTLARWLDRLEDITGHIIYLAGNTHMVIALRQQLRVLGCSGAQIFAQGYWK